MADDNKELTSALRTLTAELQRAGSAKGRPVVSHSSTDKGEEKTTKTVKSYASFALIDWKKVNSGLKTFTKMESTMIDSLKAFGSKDLKIAGYKFASTVDVIAKPLESLSKGLDAFSKVSMENASSALKGFEVIKTRIIRFIESFGSPELTASGRQFGDSVREIAYPLETLGDALQSIGKVSLGRVGKTLTGMASLPLQLTAVMKAFSSKAIVKSIDAFSLVGAKVSEPLSNFATALSVVGELSLGSVKRTIGNMSGMADDVITFMTNFGSPAMVAGAKSFSKVATLVGVPLKAFAEGLESVTGVSVYKVGTSLRKLAFLDGSLAKFMNNFGKAKLLTAASAFVKVTDIAIRPLKDFAEALKLIASVSVFKVAKALTVLPWMEGRLANFMEKFGTTKLKNAAIKFKDKTKLIAEPLKSFAEAITSFGNIPVSKAIGTALLLPIFFGTLRLTTKLMGNLSGLGKRVESMKPIMKGLKEVFVLMGDAVGAGFGALGKNLKNIALGSLAIGLIAGALALGALSFSLFAGIDWAGVFLGITALGLVAVGAAVMGASAPVILIGAAAIAALGIALIPAAYAMKIAGEAMGLMVTAATALIPNLLGLAIAGPGLIATALALGVLSTSMLAFSVATTAGGWLSKLGGNSIVDQVIMLGKQADPLNAVADALDRIVASSKQLGTIVPADQMGGVGRGQTMISAQDQIAAGQNANASQPVIVTPVGGTTNQKTSVVNNTTNVSNSIMPDRMVGMMPSQAYSF